MVHTHEAGPPTHALDVRVVRAASWGCRLYAKLALGVMVLLPRCAAPPGSAHRGVPNCCVQQLSHELKTSVEVKRQGQSVACG